MEHSGVVLPMYDCIPDGAGSTPVRITGCTEVYRGVPKTIQLEF